MRRRCGEQDLLAFMLAARDWDAFREKGNFAIKTEYEPTRYLQSQDELS